MVKYMNIVIVTGQKGSGKTTYLKKLINKNFNGIITECTNRKERKYYFELINKNRYLLCCYYDNGMKFNQDNFDTINGYLLEINNNKKNLIIDEVGWLELEENGLYKGLTNILRSKTIKKLYISMRYDIYKELINKFGIINYDLIDLSV